jgi:CMP-N,N'-diacetyllegionaminic acid synthase
LNIKKKIIALIPARSGSQRIKNKNIIKILNHPLIAHSINEAKKTRLFEKIVVSTDSRIYAEIAKKYGAEVPFLRPVKISNSVSYDFQWINYTIQKLNKMGFSYDYFFILRPTNPFRTSKTIIKAWRQFKKNKKADTLRAVEISKQNPYKMWIKSGRYIKPFLKKIKNNQPSHNLQSKSLPKILVQNASLEISKINVLKKYKTITGKKIIPFYTNQFEGFDINYPADIKLAKVIIKEKKIKSSIKI